jgi:hypothetical protein
MLCSFIISQQPVTYKSHNTEIDVKYLIDMKRRKIKYKLFTTKCGHTDI